MTNFDYALEDLDKFIHEPRFDYRAGPILFEDTIDIERARTEVVRICSEIWNGVTGRRLPPTISKSIRDLRNEGYIPRHQANMMLTLCNLRNIFVYENLNIGQNEMMVAKGAWSIIYEWWDQVKPLR